jgi:hypothetical protein
MSAATRKLRTYVHVDGTAYGPGDDLPDEVAERITNPKAWDDYDESKLSQTARPVGPSSAEMPEDLRARVAAEAEARGRVDESTSDQPPPPSGPGSGAPAWRSYAAGRGVTVPDDAKREDVVEALREAGHPVDRGES